MSSYMCHFWIQREFTRRASAEAKANPEKCELMLAKLCDQDVLEKLGSSLLCFPCFDSIAEKQRLVKFLCCTAISSVSVVYINHDQFLQSISVARNNIAAILFFKGFENIATMQVQIRGESYEHRSYAQKALILLEGIIFTDPNATIKSFMETQTAFLPPQVTMFNASSSRGPSFKYSIIESNHHWPENPLWDEFHGMPVPADEWVQIPNCDYSRSVDDSSAEFWKYGDATVPEWGFFAKKPNWGTSTEWADWSAKFEWEDWGKDATPKSTQDDTKDTGEPVTSPDQPEKREDNENDSDSVSELDCPQQVQASPRDSLMTMPEETDVSKE